MPTPVTNTTTATAGVIPIAEGGTGQATAALALAAIGAKNMAGILVRFDSNLTLTAGAGTTPSIAGHFVVSPAATSFQFWAGGVLYTKTAADVASCTVTIPAVQAQYFIYFNASGVLTCIDSPWDNTTDQAAPVAMVYWDPVTGLGAMNDERHSAQRDRQMHAYLHDTRGCAYESGFVGTFNNTTLSITQGTIHDEDIEHTTGASAATTCRLWYRKAAAPYSGGLFFENASTTPYKATAGVLKYDNAGTLSSVTRNWYVANWIYATNDASQPIECVLSQGQWTDLPGVRAATEPVFPNMSTREWKLLYKVVYKNVNDTTPTYQEQTDYRTSSSIPSAGTSTVNASNVSVVPHDTITATNVQAALEGLTRRTVSAVKTGAYQALLTDDLILCNATSAGFDVTVPVGFVSGTHVTVKKIDASVNAVTVKQSAAETIDGAASIAIATQYETITVVSDGTNWHVL